MKKNLRNRVAIPLVCMALLLAVSLVFGDGDPRIWHSSAALMCEVEEYSQEAERGYLTIRVDEKEGIGPILVEDEKLQETLSTTDPDTIIGVQLLMTVPYGDLWEKHLNPEGIDSISLLLQSRDFDQYCQIVGISTK